MIAKQHRPSGDRGAEYRAGTNADASLPNVPAYLVLLVGRNGNHLRKPYLSLRSAEQAMARAGKRGQRCHLVLCRLEPVAVADLAELDGGDQR
jgi:hypothetical protein